MRETRSSGSVEGVMGNHDSYSDRVPWYSVPVTCGGQVPDAEWNLRKKDTGSLAATPPGSFLFGRPIRPRYFRGRILMFLNLAIPGPSGPDRKSVV